MVRFKKGHKNSKGEKAEWCIVSHKTGRVISSHKSKSAAEKHLGEIQMFKHMKNESMSLNEAKQILKNAGFIIESYAEGNGDPIAVLRRDVTNGAVNRFEHTQYDEWEQEPWIEEQNIKDIEYAEFLKVVMKAVGAKTQQELLDLAEDNEMFNKMVEAWFQYLLNEKNDCMGWDYTWGGI